MLKKNYKGRCEKKQMSKSEGVCRLYSKIQIAYANTLENDDDIAEFTCNVLINTDIGEYTSDFVCKKNDGTYRVRECVPRKQLLWPSVAKLLEASRVYWMSRGIEDWGIVVDKQMEEDSDDERNI